MDYRQFADVLRHLGYDFWITSFNSFQIEGLRDLRANNEFAHGIRRELTNLCQTLKVKHTWAIVHLSTEDKVVLGLHINLD